MKFNSHFVIQSIDFFDSMNASLEYVMLSIAAPRHRSLAAECAINTGKKVAIASFLGCCSAKHLLYKQEKFVTPQGGGRFVWFAYFNGSRDAQTQRHMTGNSSYPQSSALPK